LVELNCVGAIVCRLGLVAVFAPKIELVADAAAAANRVNVLRVLKGLRGRAACVDRWIEWGRRNFGESARLIDPLQCHLEIEILREGSFNQTIEIGIAELLPKRRRAWLGVEANARDSRPPIRNGHLRPLVIRRQTAGG